MQTQRGVDKSGNKKMLKVAKQKWLNGPTCRHTKTEDRFLKGGRERNRQSGREWKGRGKEKKRNYFVHVFMVNTLEILLLRSISYINIVIS